MFLSIKKQKPLDENDRRMSGEEGRELEAFCGDSEIIKRTQELNILKTEYREIDETD